MHREWNEVRWLWIDSCGAVAELALLCGDDVLARMHVPGREFSARWPGALQEMLAGAGLAFREVQLVAVANGPGSFTGVRVGLAAAKGLCEASGAKLIALSALELLGAVGGELAVLDAGRGDLYLRDGQTERLIHSAELDSIAAGRSVVMRETALQERLASRHSRVASPGLKHAAALVRDRWRQQLFDDLGRVDANYVREERDIYSSRLVP